MTHSVTQLIYSGQVVAHFTVVAVSMSYACNLHTKDLHTLADLFPALLFPSLHYTTSTDYWSVSLVEPLGQ